MAFATKKTALDWAKHYLDKSEAAGEFIDPISGYVVKPVKHNSIWWFGYGYGDEWLNEVEDLRDATDKNQ